MGEMARALPLAAASSELKKKYLLVKLNATVFSSKAVSVLAVAIAKTLLLSLLPLHLRQ
jgi:hypothetical protein